MQTYFEDRRSTRRDRLSTSETTGRDRHPGAVETQLTHSQGTGTYAHDSRAFATVASHNRASCAAAFVLAIGVCSSVQAQHVYDFSGAHTGNTAFKGTTDATHLTIPPTVNNFPTGAFAAADFTAVAVLDDSRQTTTGGIASKALTRFVFTVTEPEVSLLDLKVDWVGNTQTVGTVNLYLWNDTVGAYIFLDSTSSAVDVTLAPAPTTTPTQYIDASGHVTVLVANTVNNRSINTNYVRISVRQCATNTDCNDSNVCTDDFCLSGLCTHSNNNAPCADEGNACTEDVCSGGVCTHPNKAPGTACGDAGTQCVNQDTCNGAGLCIDNGFKSTTTICTGVSQGGACDDDAADHCTGTGNLCADVFKSGATVCRASTDQCDIAESCTGTSAVCPADVFASASTICTGVSQGGACDNDAADHCTGINNTCVDVFKSGATVCRASTGQCDVAESCTGPSGACPPDGFKPPTTICTGVSQGGLCDSDTFDHCSGTSNLCVDVFKSGATVCRAAAGQCDMAENCTGTSGACPTNSFEDDGTPCDDGDACTTNDACQAGACVSSITYGLSEWHQMSECLAGPGTEAAVGCECSDLDVDGYVDLQDVAEFMLRFDGN